MSSAERSETPSDAGVETQLQMANLSRSLFGDEAVAVRLGRFVVLERIGAGGMGTVFRAYDPDLDRAVALKVIRREALERDPGARARLVREARTLAKLNHPNVVGVHEVDMAQDQMFVAMELVEGQDLAEWVAAHRDAAARFDEALTLLRQAGEGLAAAHSAGVIHRDFKPANVLLGADGRVRVADFGLARLDDGEPPSQDDRTTLDGTAGQSGLRSEAASDGSGSVTNTGAMMGTPAYMAPEQRFGDPIDALADQYSFCVSAWETLFGIRPKAIDADQVELPSRVSARGRHVARLLRRGLAEDPAQRYPSMGELLEELGRNPAARRRRIALGLAGTSAIGLAIGGYGWARAHRCDDAAQPARALWTEQWRAQTAEAFRAIDWDMAADSYQRFDARIDEYVTQWSEHAETTCQAARVDGTLDRATFDARRACLDDRLTRLGALLDVFAEPDRDLVVAAPVTSMALPPLAACMEGDPPAVSDASPELTRALARGLGFMDAGRYADAARRLEAVADDAEAAGTKLTEARARVGLAQAQLKTKAPHAAAQMFERAYWLALEHGDDLVAASAARGLVDSLVPTKELEEAEDWAQYARVLGRRAGVGDDFLSSLESSQGQLAFERGDLEASTAHLREAVARAVSEWGPDHPRMISVEQNLALTLQIANQLDEAAELAAHGHRVRVEHFGPRHPSVGHTTRTLAQLEGRRGRHEPAVEQFREAESIFESVYGRQHVTVGQTLSNLGVSLGALGRQAEAAEVYREAVDILGTVLGPDDRRVLAAKMNLARALFSFGRCEEVVATMEAVVSKYVERSPDHPAVGIARSILGACLGRLGQTTRGVAELEQAIELLAARPADAAGLRVTLATVLELGGELARARTETLAALEALPDGPQHASMRAEGLVRLASLDAAEGKTDPAVRGAEQALALRREIMPEGPELVAALGQHARVLIRAGRDEAAEASAREGLALMTERSLQDVVIAPGGGSLYLALAEATRERDPEASKAAAAEAEQWFSRTDAGYADDLARARALQIP